MATNKRLEYSSPIQLNVAALITGTPPVSAILSGAPACLRGLKNSASYNGFPNGMALVANNSAVSPTGSFDNFQSFDHCGAFDLTVLAETGESPAVNSAVQPGDVVFANINTGTYEATSGLFYGFTLDKNPSGIPFGRVVLGSLTGGTSGVVTVMLFQDVP
jgi:hypothetical protein